MHTYIRINSREYEIGLWLINDKGYHQFNRLLSVPNLGSAISVVNTLNGGDPFEVEVSECLN